MEYDLIYYMRYTLVGRYSNGPSIGGFSCLLQGSLDDLERKLEYFLAHPVDCHHMFESYVLKFQFV